jgi:AraC-like DNA-binding protein
VHYSEHLPDRRLAPFVKCYWSLQVDDATPETQRVLPDGCCELVVHCGDRFAQHAATDSWLQPRTLLVGPTTAALTLSPGRQVDVMAIRFKPAGAALMLRAPLTGLRDQVLSCEEAGASFGYDIVDELAPLSVNARIAILEHDLLRRLGRLRIDRAVLHTQESIMAAAGQVSISELAREAGVSLRHLQRKFQEQVGLSPKELARLARLQCALGVAHQPDMTLARVAAIAGYADQSHFTREFNAIAGISPGQFFRETHVLNDVFFA